MNPDSIPGQPTEREHQQMLAHREELVEHLGGLLRQDGAYEPVEGVRLRRISAPTRLGYGVSFPSFCVIAQGSKELLLGDNTYRYNPANYLIATTALPIASRISEASPEQPYLGFVLTLDPALVGQALVEASHLVPQNHSAVTAIDVSALDAGLLDAVVRLVRVLSSPAEARLLVPLIKREIAYRLLMGAQGDRLGQIVTLAGSNHRIAGAVERLRKDFDQPLRVEDMAHELGMSVSGFHHHFRALTAMSPLQFQKQLRLQEARRLMLGEGLDAASAGYRVGYGDASHFTREYKRLFGAPPMRDVEQLREVAVDSLEQGTV